jgi:hypothetical protein
MAMATVPGASQTVEPNRLSDQARPNVVQSDHGGDGPPSQVRPTGEQPRFEGNERELPSYRDPQQGSSLPWLGNMSASQPTAEDDSWRDTPPISEQIFDAVAGWVIALVVPRGSSLRRKAAGILLVGLIASAIAWLFTFVFLVDM